MKNIETEENIQHYIHKMLRISYVELYGLPASKEQMIGFLNTRGLDEVILLFWEHYRQGEFPIFEFNPHILQYQIKKYLAQKH
ncbi:MAG: hypothetical protein GY928_06945 [Colwellia sp.]|nr:hypothetical protein [Colwellia sp.]